MPQTADQLVALACQIAKAPGFTAQGFTFLNVALGELCQDYDFDVARGVVNFNFYDSGNPLVSINGGPIPLPADYLRADKGDVFFTIQGVPYPLINYSMSEYDMFVKQAGMASYPSAYATDLSLQTSAVPVMYVWPPPSGNYPMTVRYRRQMPDITAGAGTVPWFPDQNYLVTRVAGELMKITDDDRKDAYLGMGDSGAQGILSRYLKLKDDSSSRAQSVTLDRRTFGGGGRGLPDTKRIGWSYGSSS